MVTSLAMLALAGCATGDYAYVKTISTGERLQIPLVRGAPMMATEGNYTVKHTTILPNAESEKKQLQYLFGLVNTGTNPPKSVRVEDVTEAPAILLMEDLAPEFKDGLWRGVSTWYDGDDPELVWVIHVDSSMRVFQFRITEPDGTEIVLNQGWMVPSWAKTPMRHVLGLK